MASILQWKDIWKLNSRRSDWKEKSFDEEFLEHCKFVKEIKGISNVCIKGSAKNDVIYVVICLTLPLFTLLSTKTYMLSSQIHWPQRRHDIIYRRKRKRNFWNCTFLYSFFFMAFWLVAAYFGIKLIWLWFSLRAKQHALFRGTVFPRR